MAVFSVELIREALQSELIAEEGNAVSVSALVSDSRQMSADSMFICIRGDAFDGHQFAAHAVANGAKAILCDEKPEFLPEHVWILIVKDTINAFRSITANWRRQFDIPVIAVAGSVGKTTTKQLIAAALGGRFSEVLSTSESQNGFLGIAMTLAKLRPHHQAAVIEVGIDEPGAMKQHLQVIHPNIAVVTAVAEEHMEHFKDLRQVADEEMLPLDYVCRHEGVALIHHGDEWLSKFQCNNADCQQRYELLEDTDFDSAKDQAQMLIGAVREEALRVAGPGINESQLQLSLPGRHNAVNTLAAIAVARCLGLDMNEIRKGMKDFHAPAKRSVIIKTTQDLILIGDYYNASPASMRAAFTLFLDAERMYQGSGRRFICLGDMLELGADEERYHRELAQEVDRHQIDGVWLYGSRMKWLADELTKKHYRGRLELISDHHKLSKSIADCMKPGDRLLIKGSRGMRLEKVWDGLIN